MAGNWITGQRPLMHRVVVQALQAAWGGTSTIWWYIQAACGGNYNSVSVSQTLRLNLFSFCPFFLSLNFAKQT